MVKFHKNHWIPLSKQKVNFVLLAGGEIEDIVDSRTLQILLPENRESWAAGSTNIYLCIETFDLADVTDSADDMVIRWIPLGTGSQFSLSPPTSEYVLNESTSQNTDVKYHKGKPWISTS